MSTMTLSGREAPSTKRIDVEANLLEEWLIERRQTKKQIQLRVVGVAGVAALGMWSVSMLNEWRAGFAKKQAPVAQRLKAVQDQFGKVVPTTGGGTSVAEIQKMVESSKKNADAYMAQVIGLMNTGSQSIALSSLKVDVLGGEVKLTGQADAETYYAANEFIQRNNDPTKGMNATQVSTSRSDLLATDGVSFQFVKKAKVTQ
jgi:hypothetical protein